jgi:hypothetical protein
VVQESASNSLITEALVEAMMTRSPTFDTLWFIKHPCCSLTVEMMAIAKRCYEAQIALC